MKLLTALTGLLLFSAISQAQIPFYGGYTDVQAYYPGAIAPPFLPQAYYPQPYAFPPRYTYPYVENQFTSYDNHESVDALQRRVQQLSDEVSLLQNQVVTATNAQLQMQMQTQRSQASRPPEPATPVVLVLKNGDRLESQGYVITRDSLWIVTRCGTEKMPISQLNVAATQRENLKRGIEFPNVGS